MHYLELRKQAGALLAELGGTSAEVAMKLQDAGVRGTPKDVHGCAIAIYVSAVLGGESHIRSVRVDNTSLRVTTGQPRIPMSIRLPAAVRTFIQAFDQGRYPTLVRSERQGASWAGHQPPMR